MKNKLNFLYLGLFITFLSGCSSPDDPKQREVFPVSGIATYKGRPMPDASVVLHPVSQNDDGLPTFLPRGRVDNEGKFTISTYRKGDGAPAGTYKVSFSWLGSLQGISEEEEDKLPEKIPRKYRNPRTSGFTVEIRKTENPELKFELK